MFTHLNYYSNRVVISVATVALLFVLVKPIALLSQDRTTALLPYIIAEIATQDESEPNNSSGEAIEIVQSRSVYTGIHNDKFDYFKFYVESDGEISATLNSNHSVGIGSDSIQLQLYKSSISEETLVSYALTANERSDTYEVGLSEGGQGLYFVVIATLDCCIDNSQSYSLSINFPESQTPTVMPSDTSTSTPTPTSTLTPTSTSTFTPVLTATIEELGIWVFNGNRPPMPVAASTGQIILAYGDINDSGTCHIKEFGVGVAVEGLGSGTFKLVRIIGSPQEIQDAVDHIQNDAASDAGTECPRLSTPTDTSTPTPTDTSTSIPTVIATPSATIVENELVQPGGIRHIVLADGELIVGTADRFQGDVDDVSQPPCTAFVIRGPIEMDLNVWYGGWDKWVHIYADDAVETLLQQKIAELEAHQTCPSRGIKTVRIPDHASSFPEWINNYAAPLNGETIAWRQCPNEPSGSCYTWSMYEDNAGESIAMQILTCVQDGVWIDSSDVEHQRLNVQIYDRVSGITVRDLCRESLTVSGIDSDGVNWTAPRDGLYEISFISGAYSGWATEADCNQTDHAEEGCWKTRIMIYDACEINWIMKPSVTDNMSEPGEEDYSIGTDAWGQTAEDAEDATLRRNSNPVTLSLNEGACLAFIAVDGKDLDTEYSAYDDNRGEVKVQIISYTPNISNQLDGVHTITDLGQGTRQFQYPIQNRGQSFGLALRFAQTGNFNNLRVACDDACVRYSLIAEDGVTRQELTPDFRYPANFDYFRWNWGLVGDKRS